ncbi:MAG: hypothetical protein ABSE20_02620 [Acetobacteraceae bacterium]|jgi:hypothetical protein
MSLSGWLRAAWVAVPAALFCGGAVAQQIITVPPGVIVVVTPGRMPVVSNTSKAPVLVETSQAPSALPIERIFAEQRAMMDRMMADINAMFAPTQNETGVIDAMLRQFGSPALGVVPAAGGTFCSESVSITYNGQNGAPLVKVSHAGSGCGAVKAVKGVAQVPAITAPVEQHHPNVIEINSPIPVTKPAVRYHT